MNRRSVLIPALAGFLVVLVFSLPLAINALVGSPNSQKKSSGHPSSIRQLSVEEKARLEEDIRSGGSIEFSQDGKITSTGTGTELTSLERLPGGKPMVAMGRKIVTIYREYLDMVMDFVGKSEK